MEIEFTDEYKTGIEKIDEQHQTWVRMYNEMIQIMEDFHLTIDSDKVVEIMKGLYDYTTYHFSFEEKMIEDIGYEDITNHRRSHKSMDTEIYRFYRMAIDKEFIALGSVVKIMKNWILNHILIEDREYITPYFEHGKEESEDVV